MSTIDQTIIALSGPTIETDLVGQAASGSEGVAAARVLRPELVLMDLRMPGGDGVTATREQTDQDILRAVEAGATGYLLQDITPDDLARAVRAAARGETVLAPSAQGALLQRIRQPAGGHPRPVRAGDHCAGPHPLFALTIP